MNKKWIKFKYRFINFPVRPNLILVAGLVALVYFLFFRPSADKETDALNSFLPLVILLAKVALIIIAVIIACSLISTIVAFLIFKSRSKAQRALFRLNLSGDTEQNNAIHIQPSITHTYRPLLGYISGRLILKDQRLSDPFVLASTQFKKNSLWVDAVYGNNTMSFPDIKEYQVAGVMLYFEDMLRLIKLPVKQAHTGSFFNPPQANTGQEPAVQPQATREQDIRIEQMRNVQGEYLNYKQFEFGDDVRRIVWKVYAKNRELIVRNPEIRNPYASRIEMYASFHNSLLTLIPDSAIFNTLLNTYKNAVWSLYQSLSLQQDYELIYMPEQAFPRHFDDEAERTAYCIAQSEWQNDQPIEQYFDLKKGTVYCIHSLTDAAALEQFLGNGGADKFVYMAYLSDAFKQSSKSLLKKIFFYEEEENSQQPASWLVSPLRSRILKNEATLSRILKSYGF
ncbi:MAG: hypothetical protein BGO31_04880 [Bacteroidetes bacterium 43-16]|nr:MAG: hypothetical protein BGO31_04880 [Bacteroidetes bacterium 43-16]